VQNSIEKVDILSFPCTQTILGPIWAN